MKYPYHVKHNGVDYAPFEEIPNDVVTPAVMDATERENDTVAVEYSKTDINRMPIADLRALAKAQGIEKSEVKSGGELKKNLIEKLGL